MAEQKQTLPVEKTPAAVPEMPWGRDLFGSLHREIDRLFDAFRGGFWRSPLTETMFGGEGAWPVAPAVDIVEKDNRLELTAELPGMAPTDIELKVVNGRLMIKGEKKEEREEKKEDYYLSERRYGSFYRSFPLPDEVDTDKIEAKFENGVLRVTLPKTPEAVKAEKKIAIQAK